MLIDAQRLLPKTNLLRRFELSAIHRRGQIFDAGGKRTNLMNEAKNLSLADWPEIKITRHSRGIIRHAYEQVLDSSARLAAFAMARPTASDGPIGERQETLAVDDLVRFAIHARRLIENTAGVKRFRNVEIRWRFAKDGSRRIRITDVINTLIHHRDIEVLRSMFRLRMFAGHKPSWEDIPTKDSQDHFSPITYVTSDHGKPLIFEIEEMIETFQAKILGPIIDLCAEHELLLDTNFDD